MRYVYDGDEYDIATKRIYGFTISKNIDGCEYIDLLIDVPNEWRRRIYREKCRDFDRFVGNIKALVSGGSDLGEA